MAAATASPRSHAATSAPRDPPRMGVSPTTLPSGSPNCARQRMGDDSKVAFVRQEEHTTILADEAATKSFRRWRQAREKGGRVAVTALSTQKRSGSSFTKEADSMSQEEPRSTPSTSRNITRRCSLIFTVHTFALKLQVVVLQLELQVTFSSKRKLLPCDGPFSGAPLLLPAHSFLAMSILETRHLI